MNFDQFRCSTLRNAWLREDELDIYIRRSVLPNRGDFELAVISARILGSGGLTRFLDKWEPYYSFYIENVFEQRFGNYLERRGYSIVGLNEPPYCYLKEKS